MKRKGLMGAIVVSCLIGLSGCASVLSSDTVLDDTAGVLGVPTSEITISGKHDQGGTTYYIAHTRSGVDYACQIEGSNVMTLGFHNPPVCHKKQ